MEDILASIKRVIAEDVRPGAPRTSFSPADADEPDENDILELDESLMQQPIPAGLQGAPAEPALVSQDALDATRSSLAALSGLRSDGAPADGGPLEAVVRDMLRPLLKDWLDQRLPIIVEELVAKEVARITGRR